MRTIDLVTLVLGIGCYVGGHYLPDIAAVLQTIGAVLVGVALPQISRVRRGNGAVPQSGTDDTPVTVPNPAGGRKVRK